MTLTRKLFAGGPGKEPPTFEIRGNVGSGDGRSEATVIEKTIEKKRQSTEWQGI